MILLNLVRMIITVLALIILDALRVAYGLDGIPLALMLGLVLFVTFVIADVAEDKLIEVFNPEETASG